MIARAFVDRHDDRTDTPGGQEQREEARPVAGPRQDDVPVADACGAQLGGELAAFTLEVACSERATARRQMDQRSRGISTPQAIELVDDGVHEPEEYTVGAR